MQEYTTEDIENAILTKFDNFKDCAKALNISESTLNRNKKRATIKFLRKLESVGVILKGQGKVHEPPPEYYSENADLSKTIYQMQKDILRLTRENTELKESIELLKKENQRLRETDAKTNNSGNAQKKLTNIK